MSDEAKPAQPDTSESVPSSEPTTPGMPASGTSVPSWQIHRRMYDWVLSLAHTKHATWALFVLSFTESSFFPIPPDVLQIALTMERRAKAWWYAFVSTVGSVLGGVGGYLIGMLAWGALEPFFYDYVKGFTPENMATLESKYAEWAFVAILGAAFTPIPYKVFTVTAGVFDVSIWTLILASVLGRGGRFYAVAAIFYVFGPTARRFVEKYFNLLTIVGLVLVGGLIYVLKFMGHSDDADPVDDGQSPALVESEGAALDGDGGVEGVGTDPQSGGAED